MSDPRCGRARRRDESRGGGTPPLGGRRSSDPGTLSTRSPSATTPFACPSRPSCSPRSRPRAGAPCSRTSRRGSAYPRRPRPRRWPARSTRRSSIPARALRSRAGGAQPGGRPEPGRRADACVTRTRLGSTTRTLGSTRLGSTHNQVGVDALDFFTTSACQRRGFSIRGGIERRSARERHAGGNVEISSRRAPSG